MDGKWKKIGRNPTLFTFGSSQVPLTQNGGRKKRAFNVSFFLAWPKKWGLRDMRKGKKLLGAEKNPVALGIYLDFDGPRSSSSLAGFGRPKCRRELAKSSLGRTV